MKFDLSVLGRKKVIIGVIVLLILVSVIVIVFRSRSKYQFPIASSDTSAEGSTLTGAIASCTTLYRTAIQQGLADSTPPKAKCIQDAVNAYFSSKCSFVFSGTPPSSGTSQASYYNTYTNTDSPAITSSSQYVNLAMGTTALTNGVTLDMVLKARKSDLTGPTRKYINAACPGFYIPADTTLTDLSAIYALWTSVNVIPANPAAGTSLYGFATGSVTAAKVYEWAIKAATPITISGIASSPSPTTTSATFNISPALGVAITTNTKFKIAGILGDVTVGATSAGATSLAGTFTTQSAVPGTGTSTVSANTPLMKSTASTISSVTVSGGSAVAPPFGTASVPTTATTSATLTLGSALDDSIGTGTQVLLSGASITGPIYVSSGAGTSSVVISYNSQIFPGLPSGVTIENVMDIPLAVPLVATLPVYVTTTKATTTAATDVVVVNAGGTTASGTALGGASVNVLIPSVTFGSTPATIGATLAGANLTLTAPTSGQVWPAISAGTVLFKSSDNQPFITSVANNLYNKIGTFGSQKMLNWQIAQIAGPGTYYLENSGSKIAWGY